jgi:hypothetical protein
VYDDDYEAWTIRITAENGWLFTGAGTVSYTDTKGVAQTKPLGINSAKTMLTGSFYLTNASTVFTVNGEIKDANAVTIINNIPNAIAKVTKDGTKANFEVTANTDYKFALSPKVTYTSASITQQTLTLSKNDTVATGSAVDADFSKEFTFSGDTVSTKIAELNVTNKISGTTETHVYDGKTATVSVMGTNPRYRFINPQIEYTDKLGNGKEFMTVEVQQYGSIAKSVLSDVDPSKPITVTGQYVNVVHVETGLSNCQSAQTLPDYYLQHSHVEITLQANDNTEFRDTPILSHDNKDGFNVSKYFTVSGNKKTATIAYDLPTDYEISSLSIHAEAVPIQVIGSKFGAINAYIVTLDNLNDFANKRFIRETGTESDTNYELVDLGKYVNRIKRIYVPIASSSTDVLRCGNYNTEIQVMQPAADKITLDFGNVEVPSPNGDITDYESDIKIFIPFNGFVNLPNDYVGEQINLQIDINVLTGDGVARLIHNGVLFQVVEVRPNSDILYRTSTDLTLIGSDDWNENIFYGIEPFIYCKYFTSKNNNGRNTDLERGVISSFKGFNTFEDVTIISADNMLTYEQRAIYDALERGIYIS